MAGGMGRGGHGFLTDEEKANKPKVSLTLIKRIASYLIPYWKQILFVLISILLEAVFGLMPAILTGRIIDKGLIGKDFTTLVTLIVLTFSVIILSNLIGVLENYMNLWISQHIASDMRKSMYRHMQAMSHRFYTTSKQGDLITRMTSDISGVQSVIANTFTSILSNIIILTAALIAMYRMNWILASISLIIVPLFSIPTKRVGKTRWLLTRKSQEYNDEINSILGETLSVSGQLLVKLFTNEHKEFHKYEKANKEIVKLNIKEGLSGRWFRVVMSTFTSIGPMLIYLAGGLLIIKYNQTLSVGDITVMVALLSRMYQPINALMNIQVDIVRSMALFTRIFDYLDMPVEIENAPDARAPASTSGQITFEHVAFHYDKEKPILKDISFTLNSGKSVAIVGPSGSGKSTLIQLIPRLYDVTSGRILLDGHDLRSLDLDFLRQNIGMVTQDTYLFNGTLRENLLYAKSDATDAELIAACKKASLHDFISAQSKGYETMVGNRGLKLSGGEKQRLSIARVILKNPALLIFDEATSALDSISESAIQDAIDPLMAGRTSIVIAHRLSTIMAADEILVLDKGKIVEHGTHSELLSQEGVYTKLYKTQFQKALDDYDARLHAFA